MSGQMQHEVVTEFEDVDTEERELDIIEQAFLDAKPDQDIVIHRSNCRVFETNRYLDCDCDPLFHFVRGARA